MLEGLLQPVHLLLIVILLGVALVPAIFYLLTLRKALERCDRRSRTTSPDSVWLLLIPIFNAVYQFILVGDIAKSLANEFARRGMVPDERAPGKTIGIAMCILHIVGVIPILGIIFSLAGVVCWILYWMTIADHSGRIAIPCSPAEQQQNLR